MRILLSWLRDFVDVSVDIDELATALTMRGFEVAAVDRAPSGASDDAVLDLEITTNRPDCLSVTGIAREVAAMYGAELRLPAPPSLAAAGADLPELSVTLEDADLCPRYAAAVAAVAIAPSPEWLAQRLEAAGVRAINNIVDVTNYVLLELGHPMHAFDFDRLGGAALRIRRAKNGEQVRTLDGQMRSLSTQMLVIADAERPHAIAGVMGGAESEVSRATSIIALESAYFQPVSVRRTSKQIGLSTDASYRFERGADESAPVSALERCCELLQRIGASTTIGPAIDRYPAPRQPTRVRLRHARIEHLLGQSIDAAFITGVLDRLGFTAHEIDRGVWDVEIPLRRVDVTREVDLIEEVARHYGYDRLPSTFPVLAAASPLPDPRIERDRVVRRLATAAGYSEAVTFAFIDADAAAAFVRDSAHAVDIGNPLSAQFAVLRPSLIPGIVTSVAYNHRRERRDIRLFEVATRFTHGGEIHSMGLACTGAATEPHWSTRPRDVDFFDIKGSVEQVCAGLGVPDLTFEPTTCPFLVPGRAAAVRAPSVSDASQTHDVGIIGQLAPAVAARLGLDDAADVYVAELNLDALAGTSSGDDLQVTPLPRHPSIVRDLSIVITDTLPASTVRGTIRAAAPETLVEVREFDRYAGSGIATGAISLSLRLTFRAPDRTLTDAEVQQAIDRVVTALAKAHDARLR